MNEKDLEFLPVVGDLTRSHFCITIITVKGKENGILGTEGLVNGNDHDTREAEWPVGDMRDGKSRHLPC